MKIQFICLILCFYCVDGKFDEDDQDVNEDAWLTVPEIIVKYGYPFESHEVITEDGYILSVHRIPHGRKMKPHSGHRSKRVIWLQHGLLGDSSSFLMNTVDKALAYVLADAGYDVWLGNSRGNTYSRKHLLLSPDDDEEEFWDFSWNEMGLYDIPAVLNKILTTTHQSSIYYAGYSMGTTMMFVALSEHPHLNKRIRLFNCLSPVAYLGHTKSPVLRVLLPILDQLDWIANVFGVNELLPSNNFKKFMNTITCDESSNFARLCENAMFLFAGYDWKQLNKTILPMVFAHYPSGASVRSLLHFVQCAKSGTFGKYDYGPVENLYRYGQKEAPNYDLSKVLAPTTLYWADNDWLGPPVDVKRTAGELRNVVLSHRMEFRKYSHMDFLWAIDNDKLLNRPFIRFMKKF